MKSLVGFEVRAFRIGLCTSGRVAKVHPPPLQFGIVPSVQLNLVVTGH